LESTRALRGRPERRAWTFKGQNGDLFTRLFQELAAKTANDPVAGNPNSLEANTVQSSFDNGFTSKVSETQTSAECATAQGASGAAKSVNAGLIGLAASYGYMRAGNLASNSYRVPLSYSFRSNTDPNRQLNVRLPVTLVDVEGAQSWGIGAGLSYTWPITCNWFITPGVDYGLVASVDMASVGQMVTGSLTSAYVIDMGKTSLSIGNMVGYGQTLPFTYQDYTFDPDIQNTILRNGVMWMVPTEFMIKNTAVELFVTDTRYFGSDLFIDNYQEFGFSYGFRKTASKTKGSTIKNLLRYLRAGVTYIYSEQSSGVKLNFGYTF
jgi:hypothetical protein